jgi:hypothetical protein
MVARREIRRIVFDDARLAIASNRKKSCVMIVADTGLQEYSMFFSPDEARRFAAAMVAAAEEVERPAKRRRKGDG